MSKLSGRDVLFFVVGVILLGTSVMAQNSSFRVRQMRRDDIPAGQGQCDIRLKVDDEVVVALRGDMLEVRTIRGNGWRDEGCECNQPLPNRDVQNFRFRGIDGRGSVDLTEAPSHRNAYRAVVRILDSKGGSEGYHYRLTWDAVVGSGNWDNDHRNEGYGRNYDYDSHHGRDQTYASELQIIEALYGASGHYRPVTDRVRRQVRNNRVSLLVSNDNLGGDPASGHHKELLVTYRYRNGRQEQTRVREGDYLDLPNPRGDYHR